MAIVPSRMRQRPSLAVTTETPSPASATSVAPVVAEAPVAAPEVPRRVINTDSNEGTVEVTRAIYHRGRLVNVLTDQSETVRVPMFQGPVARVRIEGSVTRNLGDFNSVRVAVMVELPCYPEESELRRAYAYGSDFVDELVGAELARQVGAETGVEQHP